MKIQEATAFIEKNNHPKLWALLAEVALNRLDTVVAEHAFVMLKDYAGIQLIKRINALQVNISYYNYYKVVYLLLIYLLTASQTVCHLKLL